MQPEPLRLAQPNAPTVERLQDRPEAQPTGPLMITDEVADLLQVSRRCVERWDAAGKVPGKVRLPGRLIRWKRAVVLEWIEAGCPTPARPRKAR